MVAEGHYWRIIIHLCLCFGSVKTCIFHFLSCWVVNTMGTVADCVSWYLRLAAALKQFRFSPIWTQISLLSEGQHLLLKDVSGLWSSTFTVLWPFPFLWPCLTNTGQHRSSREDLCLTLTTRGCFLPFCLWCKWKNKTWFTMTDRSGLELLCQGFEWWCYTARYLCSREILGEEMHVQNYFDPYKCWIYCDNIVIIDICFTML